MSKEFEKLNNILMDFFEDINYFICPQMLTKRLDTRKLFVISNGCSKTTK